MFRISLTHAWTKETISLEVEHITATYVGIRWPLQGVYDLNLKRNVLTARSLKAQRKNEKPLWVASDIDAVRKMVKDYLAEKEGYAASDTRDAISKHNRSMPK